MPNNPFMKSGKERRPAGTAGQDFVLAAVYSVNTENTAVRLLLDGTDAPTQKYYKALTGAWPMEPDDRVIVMKMSGTYVVVGKIGGKPADPEPPTPTFIAAPNTVFAGPATGTESAEATFRTLTADDIPGGGGGEVETVVETVVANIITPTSPATVGEATFASCGKMANLYLKYRTRGTAAVVTSGSKTIGTLLTGKRPAADVQVIMQRPAASANAARIETVLWIRKDGTVTHIGNASQYDDCECSVSYLLP
jgi:hypothetical protein